MLIRLSVIIINAVQTSHQFARDPCDCPCPWKIAPSKWTLPITHGYVQMDDTKHISPADHVFSSFYLLIKSLLLALMLPHFFKPFFIHLKLELLTQFPAPNEEE